MLFPAKILSSDIISIPPWKDAINEDEGLAINNSLDAKLEEGTTYNYYDVSEQGAIYVRSTSQIKTVSTLVRNMR
jgi:hypothetical protein